MAVFESKACVVYAWDATGAVRAMRIQREREGRLRVMATAMSDEGDLATNLAAIKQAMPAAENELVLCGGNLAGAVCFEHDFPRMSTNDLRQAITYELSRQVPMATEELICAWRQIPVPEGGRMRIRVQALQQHEWNRLLDDLTAAKLQVDAVIAPWLALDPLLGEEDEVILPGLDDGFAFRRHADSGGRRTMVMAGGASVPAIDATAAALGLETTSLPGVFRGDDASCWLPTALLAAYALGAQWRRDQGGLLPLPSQLRPARFQLQRGICAVLLALAALLAMAFGVRLAIEARRQHRLLAHERLAVVRQIQEFDARNRAMTPVDEVVRQLAKAELGVEDLLSCLHRLTNSIPKSMSLNQLNIRGNNFELNLRTVAESDDNLSDLEADGQFRIRQQQKRRNADGSTNIFLRLNYQPPKSSGKDGHVETD